jgi:hypothetical protein
MNKPEKTTINTPDNSDEQTARVTQDIGLSPDKPERPDSNDVGQSWR